MTDATVLLVSGSTWTDSPQTRILRRLHHLAGPDIRTTLYDGLSDLPAFVPGAEREPVAVRDLLDRIDSADAVMFSTPEYAGGLPGALKNLVDWTIGGCLDRKPVAWLDVTHPGRGAAAHAQLRAVLADVGAHVVESACVHLSAIPEPDGASARSSQDRRLAAALSIIAAIGTGGTTT